jgi:hypothetical protein
MSIYYKTQTRVTQEMLKDAPVNDEYIQRQMALKLIKDMPLEALSKLFKFEKFDPFSEESNNVLKDAFTPDWHKERIMHFREIKQLEYEASVTVA